MKKIAVLTSGGDAPGMNAAIRAVVRCGIDAGFEITGIRHGYKGLLENDMCTLTRGAVGDILHRGGTMLKTARSKEFATDKGLSLAVGILEDNEINCLIVIGGDGSMKGAFELYKRGINVMCLPGTIDNDVSYTDYTIGFDTAVNTVLDAISHIRDTSSAHERTTVIEVMGRECGDIALHSAIAGGAECALIPEVDFDIEDVCKKVRAGAARQKLHSIIIKAEGSKMTTDEVVKAILEKTGRETKPVVLSYLQRGGSPTAQDRLLATLTAARAVELVAHGICGRAVGMVDGKVTDYAIEDAIKMPGRPDTEIFKYVDILSK